jgi:hypothetical protein
LSPTTQPPPDAAKRPHRARPAQGDGADTAPSPDPAVLTAEPAPRPHHAPHAHGPHAHGPHTHPGQHRKPHAEIAHATHGRIRLKIPAAKSNPELLHQIRVAFEGHPGIDAIHVKPGTGSIVIHYDPAHHQDIPSLFASLDNAPTAPVEHMAPLSAAVIPAHHKPSTKLDEELSAIEEEAEFLAEHSHAARVVVDYIKAVDRQLKRSTNNNVDLKILAPVGLAAFTIMEIGVATATPMWVTLLLFSLNHFVELHAHDADNT